MENKYIKVKDSFTIKNGEVKELTISFIGNLNEGIVDFYNKSVDSPMYKAILHVLNKVTKTPVNIGETQD